jgi:hypothetical protein
MKFQFNIFWLLVFLKPKVKKYVDLWAQEVCMHFKFGWENSKLQNQDRCLIVIFIAVLPKIGWAWVHPVHPVPTPLWNMVLIKLFIAYYPLSTRLGRNTLKSNSQLKKSKLWSRIYNCYTSAIWRDCSPQNSNSKSWNIWCKNMNISLNSKDISIVTDLYKATRYLNTTMKLWNSILDSMDISKFDLWAQQMSFW